MANHQGHIGVFDSGVGGISVLQALVRELPSERFLYFGDSANAPYGDKTPEHIEALSRAICERMVDAGCKAVVVACNTATAAAADSLRAQWPQVPILGIEPALKPAVLAFNHRPVLVMATAATLRLEKYHELALHWGSEAQVFTVSCAGLAELVETGDLDSPAMNAFLQQRLGPYAHRVEAVVLGCTHYPFVKRQVARVLGPVAFFDGGEGTARHLRRTLQARGLLAPSTQEGAVVFQNSIDTPVQIALSQRLFALPI